MCEISNSSLLLPNFSEIDQSDYVKHLTSQRRSTDWLRVYVDTSNPTTRISFTFLHCCSPHIPAFCTNIVHRSYIFCTQVQVFCTTLHFLEKFTAHLAILHCTCTLQ